MKKKTYTRPEFLFDEFRVEQGFTMSDPWADGEKGSDDFGIESSYDNEFE